MKQYTIEEAYIDNVGIRCFDDGEETGYKIVSNYAIEDFCSDLENNGYTRAYDVQKYEKFVRNAEEYLKWAIEDYENALKHPLIKI